MKRVLSTMAQSSSKTPLALNRQQNIILLLMTCFALALTAPTTPVTSSISSTETLKNPTENIGTDSFSITSTTTSKGEPIRAKMSSNRLNDNNEFIPVPMTISSKTLDTITNVESHDANTMMKTRLHLTTTSEDIIGTTTQSEGGFTLNMQTTKYDNGTIKIHELNESPESSSSTSQMPSTVKSDSSDSSQFENGPPIAPIELNENNENKSINFDVKAKRGEIGLDVNSVKTTPGSASTDNFAGAQSIATTIEMPIKVDADNLKIMENERDFPTSTSDIVQQKEGLKKGKLKDSKKKALKAQGGTDKKQKLKQKSFSEINHSAIVPSNEQPPPTAQFRTDKASEVYETTTHEATVSTSIKTAPTTIKSTTLTTIKSFQLESDTTQPLSNEKFSTESPLNFNETEPETESPKTTTVSSSEPSVTANEQHNHSGDKFIVLNTNSSGLIVVDFLENFGTENASNTETFEIKMDLIDDATTTEGNRKAQESDRVELVEDVTQKALDATIKDDIFLTTVDSTSTIDKSNVHKIDSTVPTNDDIILINENNESTTTPSTTLIKWNELKSDEGNGNIKITFDNIDLPNQNVNVSIENGELVIDSIDISVLNRAEEELKKRKLDVSRDNRKLNKTDSLEIILIEDDSHQEEKDINRDNLSENDESNLETPTTSSAASPDKLEVNDDGGERETKINENNGEESQTTTIHFDLPTMKHDHLKKIERGGSDEEDGIKIKTTDKDSDTIFYISNTEVKVIESIPTTSPNVSHEKKYYPAIYEEDVIVDVPRKNRTNGASSSLSDKYEEDIVLSPLTSDFDPKDINYIGEAFLDVEESQNIGGMSENHHIIPLTSDVVIQPVQLHDMPSVGIPIIGELPPQIELEEMVFSDDYDSKQQSNFRVEEYYPNFLSNRLVKNQLEADVPKEMIFDSKNSTPFSSNRTHISINTMINGTNTTALSSSLTNATAYLVESENENENADLNDIQTLLLACFATLTPLFLCVIILLTIRYCWRKYRRQGSSGNDMMSDKSTDPLAEKNIASSADELKSAESGMNLDRGENIRASTELLLAANGDCTPNNHSGTNGSIITMTLKNNHLIVETEERNDISRDTRETKMHYSPSEKDGVFIVESARGADQNGSHKPSPLLQKPSEAPLVIPEKIKIDTLQSHFTPSSPEEEHKQPKPEQVEVHTPPADLKEVMSQKGPEPIICNGAKTGLSQSDLSLTSSNSSNQNYTYGDKEAYQFEEKGYKGSSPKRIINVHCHDLKPLIENSPPAPIEDLNKPIIMSAIFKNDSPEDGEPLKSDAQATEGNGIISQTNGGDFDKAKVHKINGFISTMKNGLDEIISVPDENCNEAFTKIDCNGELNMDSLSFLPAPPEELNDQCILELTSMDSLPPPPPTEEVAQS